MAYVPPHKRLLNTQDAPPMPAQMIPQSEKSVNLKDSSRHGSDHKKDNRKQIFYSKDAISKWLAVPAVDGVQLPSSLSLVPVCIESRRQASREKPRILVNGHLQQEHHDTKNYDLEHMWAPVIETVHADLLSAFDRLKNGMVDQDLEVTKPKIVARFGKVLFRRNPSLNLNFVNGNLISESYIKNLKREFYTNVPMDYMEHIKNVVVPEFSVQFEEEKELYHVKLADAERPKTTICCNCRVKKDEKKLEPYKIELKQVRHLVEDISCLESNVDLRLALYTKKTLIDLQDEEEQNIGDLISSAIFDPNVKGGIRWPLGEANSGGRYSIVGVWHTKAEAYNSSSLRLKVREADRFNFLATTSEFTREIILGLTGIAKNLLEQRCEPGSIMAMLEDALKLIRNHFLAWEGSLVSCSES